MNPPSTEISPAAARQRSTVRLRWSVVALLSLSLATAGGLSALHLARLEAAAQAEARNLLQAVSDLKVRQITRWRKERLADANLVRGTPYTARRALDVLAQPNGPTRSIFTACLTPLLEGGAYKQTLLLDASLQMRLAYPDRAVDASDNSLREAAAQALRTRQIMMTDLHRQGTNGAVQMELLVPFSVRRERDLDHVPAAGQGLTAADRSVAVLVLLIDAREFLFPLLESWPTRSGSAETLLVRRDGNDWLLLSDPRQRVGAALSQRLPARQIPSPPSGVGRNTAVSGEVQDYRGVPVLAVAQAVPETPWFVVAKIDRNEVYASIHQLTQMVWTGLGLLALASGLGAALLWRRQEAFSLRERLRVERERLSQARRVEYLMKNAQDTILMMDEDLRLVEANDRAVESYGYTLRELLQMRLPQLRPPAERASLAQLADRLRAEGHARFETLHQRKDGSTFAVEGSTRRIELEGVHYYLSIIRDVTEQRRLETRLRSAQKLESVGQLAGGVAHHFNNILAAMILQLNLLRLRKDLSSETQEALEQLERGAKRAASLTRELLTFSRRSALSLKVVNLNGLIQEFLANLGEVAGPPIELSFQPDPQLPQVEADAGLLQQVLVNLTANARDAMPNGGRLTLSTTTIDVDAAQTPQHLDLRPGRFACLKVTDTGRGMDPATLSRLFEPFFTTKEVGQGTGLGLPTIYGIAALHHGWVEVESQLGFGTSFRVFIPAVTGVHPMAESRSGHLPSAGRLPSGSQA